MKILHTSDLHIGKRLHQIDLMDDQRAFFTWLVKLIEDDSIEVLLVSGDIFDVANPSSEARKLYYEFLVQLSRLNCRVIITGGNHDSPGVLEAPKEILKALDVFVVGSKPDNITEMIIEIPDDEGNLAAIVAAIPFLRDRDLRKMIDDERYEDRVEAIKSGLIKTYTKVAAHCKSKYPGVPAIAMGHLYLATAGISESEREIQIGNLAGLEATLLPEHFQYYALGHLHKPQEMDNPGIICYSGAPYPLSFGEKAYKQRVNILTLDKGKISTNSTEVPTNRKLLKFSGTLEEVKDKLNTFEESPRIFPSLIEVEVIEENEDPGIIAELELAIDSFKTENAIVVKSRIQFQNKTEGTHELYSIEKNIEDLSPKDVFNKRIESESLPEETAALLMEAFEEICEMVYQNEN